VTASLGHDHQLVSLVTSRARAFPFYHSTGLIKPLVVQKYALGNQYKDHYDWFFDSPTLDGNIESTFFVYIEANCTGGGTNFPRLRWPVAGEKGKREEEELWCKWVDCERPWDEGVTFRPVTGNAIFWMNLKDGGRGEGDLKTLHAGLPVTSGTKMVC
jgi:prolyl 4-hydroxylase